MADHLSIVEDGYARWWSGATASVRQEVAAEYAELLKAASFWRRWLIQQEIEREVLHRMKDVPQPSPEALF